MRHNGVIAVCIVGLLAASSAALYYRNQAAGFERKWREAAAAAIPPAGAVAPAAKHVAESEHGVTRQVEAASSPRAVSGDSIPAQVAPAALVTNSWMARRQNNSGNESGPRRGSDWISVLKTNDPARYEAMQQHRQEARETAENAYIEASDFFLNRDVSQMADADMEEYSRMMSLLDETRALTLQLQSDLPRDERWQTMTAVRSNMVALTPLLSKERDRELYDLAVAMGQSPTDAVSMVSYVNQITSNTSLRVIFPDLSHGGPGGGRHFEGGPPAPRP